MAERLESVEAARKRINRPLSEAITYYEVTYSCIHGGKNSLPVVKESGLHRKCSLCVSNCLGIQGPTLFHGDGSNCGPRLNTVHTVVSDKKNKCKRNSN